MMELGIGLDLNQPGQVMASSVLGGPALSSGPSITAPTIQYKCDEASGSLLDSIGSRHLTAVNSPGSVAGQVGDARSFDGTNYFSGVADSTAMCLGVDFGFSVWFKVGVASGTRQVLSCRNAGSSDGDLLYILRYEGTALKLYIGLGSSANFSVFDVGTVATDGIYHCAISVVNATKAVRGVFNGGAAASIGTSTYVPTNSPASPKLGVGGDVLELPQNGSWGDAIQIWSGYAPSDAELEALGAGVEF